MRLSILCLCLVMAASACNSSSPSHQPTQNRDADVSNGPSADPSATPSTTSTTPPIPSSTQAPTATGFGGGSGFGAGSSAVATNDNGLSTSSSSITATPGGLSLTPDCDPTKDFWMLAYPADIQSCLASGKIYDFGGDRCTPQNQAPFPCDFHDAAAAIAANGLPADAVAQEQQTGAKLIGCGATNDGFTIVLQFYNKDPNSPPTDCSYSHKGKVSSLCFQRYAGDTPLAPADANAYVETCMVDNMPTSTP